ncbi:MAG: arylsulfatase [Planctomycetaceae bacterium]
MRWLVAVVSVVCCGTLIGGGDASCRLMAQEATSSPAKQSIVDVNVIPRPKPPFGGTIGETIKQSTPDFPKQVAAPKGAPNVLLILTDDVGFGASSTFGGPIPTPNLDRLAKGGLRYNMFHTTALCSPSRAALISGRNHHTCSTGVITELASGFPGYDSIMSKSCGTIANVLRGNGYNTSWFGKNHNVPDFQSSQVGPFDLWPTGLGFEKFYGFIGADSFQWAPAIFDGTKPVEPQLGKEDYHFDVDMADQAIKWMQLQNAMDPGKPFFMYYATGTAHAPHHAPKEWIAKFKGQFDQGWQKVREETFERQKKLGIIPVDAKLPPYTEDYQKWDDLTPGLKKVCARQMEAYAAALSHCDNNIGRVLDALEQSGEMDNTLIFYIMGDNGCSAEDPSGHGLTNEVGVLGNGVVETEEFLLSVLDDWGSDKTFNHFSHSWAHAMNTPFQWDKKVASHFGGTRNGMVIHFPKAIKEVGGLRSQFHHLIDVAPTIYEVTGVEIPTHIDGIEQRPIEGVSMAYTFDAANAKAKSHHTTQYFEIVANRAIYHDGWMASTTPKRLPWVTIGNIVENPVTDYDWELYNIETDFTQATNVAAENPEKLEQMKELFMVEARKYQVLPLDDRYGERGDVSTRPSLTRDRDTFTFFEGMTRIPEGSAPDLKNRSYRISADVVIPEGGANGVLMTQGGRFGGYGLLLLDGKLTFVHAFSNQPRHKFKVAASEQLVPGQHSVVVEFTYDGGGKGKGGTAILAVDGKEVARGKIPRTIPTRVSLDETLDFGEDCGTPVLDDYTVPFKFTGELEKVVIELK